MLRSKLVFKNKNSERLNNMKLNDFSYLKKYGVVAIPLMLSSQVQGLEFYKAGIEGSLTSEISLGSSWRVEEQDMGMPSHRYSKAVTNYNLVTKTLAQY